MRTRAGEEGVRGRPAGGEASVAGERESIDRSRRRRRAETALEATFRGERARLAREEIPRKTLEMSATRGEGRAG